MSPDIIREVTTPYGARKRMRKMLPDRADIVDRPSTRRKLLLMKSEGATAQLEKELSGLLKTAQNVEVIGELTDKLEASGADKALVADLRKAVESLTAEDTDDGEGEGEGGGDDTEDGKKVLAKKVEAPKRPSVARWIVSRLNTMQKEETVPDKEPAEGKELKPDEQKADEKPTMLTKDELMKAVSESFAGEAFKTAMGSLIDDKIKDAITPLTKRVDDIAEKKGLKKSIDGQETQKDTEKKLPMKKEFGKGMFDDVISPARVAFLADRVSQAQYAAANGSAEEE